MGGESRFRNLDPAYAAFTVLDDMRYLRSSYRISQEGGVAGEVECRTGKRGGETGCTYPKTTPVAVGFYPLMEAYGDFKNYYSAIVYKTVSERLTVWITQFGY
ncbi:hypothetical protein AtubIFM61612_009462 [Aspergillus tubingensis]|nr:hypothetical protein AtubIFM61612_009462 [Aspergillus tubingensis]